MARVTVTDVAYEAEGDATERGWWFRGPDGVLDIVVSGTLDAGSDRALVLAAIARQLRADEVVEA